MKDYIEREAAIAAAFSATSLRTSAFRDVYDTVNRLRLILTANVVEVVRCGECKFWNAPPSCEGLARCQTGESGVRFRKAYDFCSRGKKKMDGGVNDGV